MSISHTNPGIVLRTRSYGDSDCISTFLTRDFGKLAGIAKGARRSRRRFVNSLDPLSRVHVHFRLRPGATLAFLERSDLVRAATVFREPLRLGYATYLSELADRLTIEHQPVREVYELLKEGLEVLEDHPASAPFLRAFELQLLGRTGYDPPLEKCSACGRKFSDTDHAYLDAERTILRCSACSELDTPDNRIDPAVLPVLAALKRSPLLQAAERSLTRHENSAAEFVGTLLAQHLTRPLKSLDFISQTRQDSP